MKRTYRVTVYAETYTEIDIVADDEFEAGDLALAGEYEDDAIHDVTTKESSVVMVETES